MANNNRESRQAPNRDFERRIAIIELYNMVLNNIEQLRSITQDLSVNLIPSHDLGLVMTNFCVLFLPYGDFAANYSNAIKRVEELQGENGRKSFKMGNNMLDRIPLKGRTWTLLTLLEEALYHVTRYREVVTKIFKETPEEHKEHESLKEACDHLNDIVLYMSEERLGAENLDKIKEIKNRISGWYGQDLRENGKFIKEGKIKIIESGEMKKRYIFIFDKAILFCQIKRNNRLVLYRRLNFSNYKIAKKIPQNQTRPRSLRNLMVSAGSSMKKIFNKYTFHVFVLKTDDDDYVQMFAKSSDTAYEINCAIRQATDNIYPLDAKKFNHKFTFTDFNEPTPCDVCSYYLKGHFYQGYSCKDCKINVHKKCLKLVLPCPPQTKYYDISPNGCCQN